jgi:hypothetical protein
VAIVGSTKALATEALVVVRQCQWLASRAGHVLSHVTDPRLSHSPVSTFPHSPHGR